MQQAQDTSKIPEGYVVLYQKSGQARTARRTFSTELAVIASDPELRTGTAVPVEPNFAMLLDLAKKARPLARRRPDWFGLTTETFAELERQLEERIEQEEGRNNPPASNPNNPKDERIISDAETVGNRALGSTARSLRTRSGVRISRRSRAGATSLSSGHIRTVEDAASVAHPTTTIA
jgi:hypothetical protein